LRAALPTLPTGRSVKSEHVEDEVNMHDFVYECQCG
jgi:hypothetical protein